MDDAGASVRSDYAHDWRDQIALLSVESETANHSNKIEDRTRSLMQTFSFVKIRYPNATKMIPSDALRRQTCLSFGFLSLILMTIIVMVLLANQHSSNDSQDKSHAASNNPTSVNLCYPLRSVPNVSVVDYASTDEGAAFARLGGYVELFEDNETSYLPLDFQVISHDRLYDGPQVVTLMGDCVQLDIRYTVISAGNTSGNTPPPPVKYAYQGLDMHIRNGRKAGKVPRKMCEFQSQFRFEQPGDTRYSCKQTRGHLCYHSASSKMAKLRANLVLVTYELEFGEEPRPSQKKFQKEPLQNSCDKWKDACAQVVVPQKNSTAATGK
jgi:hypothetical protein